MKGHNDEPGTGYSRRDALLGIGVLVASSPLRTTAATANETPRAIMCGQALRDDARYLRFLSETVKACLPVDLPRRQRCYVSRIDAAVRLVQELPFAEASARDVALQHRNLTTTIIGFSDLMRDALPQHHPARTTLVSLIDAALAMNTRVVQAADAIHADQQSPSPWSIS